MKGSKVIAKARGIAERIYDKTLAKKADKMTVAEQMAGIRKMIDCSLMSLTMMRLPRVTMPSVRARFLEDAGLPKDVKKYAGMGWSQQQIKDYFWGCEAFRKLWADMEMSEATLDELIRSAFLDYATKP